MDDKNKEPEKMNKNEEMQAVEEEDLQNVAGGNSYTDKIEREIQNSVMTQEELEKCEILRASEDLKLSGKNRSIDELIDIYNSLSSKSGGPLCDEANEIRLDLKFLAKKYRHISKIRRFERL